MDKKKTYSVAGISAGNGVTLFPFKDKVIFNTEIRSDYLIQKKPLQWKLNFNPIPFFKTLPDNFFPDVIIGNPKCGYSSMFALSRGKTLRSQKDSPSLNLYFQAIFKYMPKVFLLENLPGLLDSFSFKDLKVMFPGYHLIRWIGSVSEFGNSQITRVRLILIGIKRDFIKDDFIKLLSNPYKVDKIKPTKFLLKELPLNGHFRESLDETITVYGGFKQTLREIQQFWKSNPNTINYPVNNGKMTTAPGVYRLKPFKKPKTVRKTNRQFNPEGLQMSPRELARIQGIPDNFLLLDPSFSPISKKTLINKGRITVANTPPYQVGVWFKEILDKIFNNQ